MNCSRSPSACPDAVSRIVVRRREAVVRVRVAGDEHRDRAETAVGRDPGAARRALQRELRTRMEGLVEEVSVVARENPAVGVQAETDPGSNVHALAAQVADESRSLPIVEREDGEPIVVLVERRVHEHHVGAAAVGGELSGIRGDSLCDLRGLCEAGAMDELDVAGQHRDASGAQEKKDREPPTVRSQRRRPAGCGATPHSAEGRTRRWPRSAPRSRSMSRVACPARSTARRRRQRPAGARRS